MIALHYQVHGTQSLPAGTRRATLPSATRIDAVSAQNKLWGSDLRGARLRGADLHGAILCSADLAGADLRAVDLRGANLANARLEGADLRGAQLQDADLRGARLEAAQLAGARYDRRTLWPEGFEPWACGAVQEVYETEAAG